MKMKLLLAASALLALTACDKIGLSQKAEPVAEAPVVIAPPTAEEAAAIVGKMDAAFASGDPVQVAALYTPDAVVLSTTTNDVIKTSAGVLADATEFMKLQATPTTNAHELQVLDADTIVSTSIFTLDFKKKIAPPGSPFA